VTLGSNTPEVERWLYQLASSLPAEQEAARVWLEQQGPAIIPALANGLHNEQLGTVGHQRILFLLANLAREETLPAILDALQRGDPIVRFGAMEAISVFRARVATEALVALLDDPDPDVVKHAAILLGKKGDPEAAESLQRLLERDAPSVRYVAAGALAQLGTPQARAALADHLGREADPETRALIERAL
jgi:HEAT repeat protein